MLHTLNTSYIAHLNRVKDEHKQAIEDLGQRGFPCLLSNEILNTGEREYPFCSRQISSLAMENRVAAIRESSFFLMFIEDSQHNDIAAFELGLACQSKSTIVVLIGSKPRSGIHLYREKSKIISAEDYDNFVALRFP